MRLYGLTWSTDGLRMLPEGPSNLSIPPLEHESTHLCHSGAWLRPLVPSREPSPGQAGQLHKCSSPSKTPGLPFFARMSPEAVFQRTKSQPKLPRHRRYPWPTRQLDGTSPERLGIAARRTRVLRHDSKSCFNVRNHQSGPIKAALAIDPSPVLRERPQFIRVQCQMMTTEEEGIPSSCSFPRDLKPKS